MTLRQVFGHGGVAPNQQVDLALVEVGHSLPAIGVDTGGGSFLEDYDPATYTNAGYSVLFGDDLSSYSDTDELLNGISISSRNGRAPVEALVDLVLDDEIFPYMMEWLSPYNNGWTGAVGSAGELPNFTHVIGASNQYANVWWRFVRRYGGTAHPTRPSSGNYTHDGDFPSGSADSIKVNFGLWTGTNYNGGRIDIAYSNANTLLFGAGYGTGAGRPIVSEDPLSEPGVTDLFSAGTINESALFTGEHVFEYTFNYYRVSDDIAMYRVWRQQLDNNGAWDPQARRFSGLLATRSSGAVLPYLHAVEYYANKNNTTKDDLLSSQPWDDDDSFSDSSGQGSYVGAGLKPFRGVRWYMGPMLIVRGGDNKPFTDHLGNNLDDDGRGDADWPPGA